MKIRWTRNAADDLVNIVAFIAEDNPKAATALAKKIRTAAGRLSKFPRRGRIVPEFENDIIREIIVGNYRIIYRIKPKLIEVASVFEGHRLIPTDPSKLK